ncbi:DUF2909 domain-containing protein [Parachitinimonas caeni]|uniref:DUF2909 domain-containing protein n=1 Tax=Parachitinimonas caeni TaxID=3031301 RepID=A0ABT7DVA8_9NEIS|nr:DUF2909 domain-containing protein [Parachitinimonas caeni]MDK2123997.1 DUF2909 domain-containing protein [Parachitinimonas caeni]
MKPIAIILLILICVLLGSAMKQLIHKKNDNKAVVRALSIRVALSIGLFILLLLANYLGWITPHGATP